MALDVTALMERAAERNVAEKESREIIQNNAGCSFMKGVVTNLGGLVNPTGDTPKRASPRVKTAQQRKGQLREGTNGERGQVVGGDERRDRTRGLSTEDKRREASAASVMRSPPTLGRTHKRTTSSPPTTEAQQVRGRGVSAGGGSSAESVSSSSSRTSGRSRSRKPNKMKHKKAVSAGGFILGR